MTSRPFSFLLGVVRFVTAVLFLHLSLAPSSALAEPGTVLLADGGRVDGDILIYLPGERVVVETTTGETFTFEGDLVEGVRYDDPEALGPSSTAVAPSMIPAPGSYGDASQAPAARDYRQEALRIEYEELSLRRNSLAAGWGVMGSGLVLFVVGTVVFARAYDADTGELNRAGDIAGLVLMPIGAVLTLVGVGILASRGRRRRKLARLERLLAGTNISMNLARGSAAGAGLGMTTGCEF